jgi:hypothetical protein
MLFATEYKIEDYVKYPIMQAKYKENIETQSKGADLHQAAPRRAAGHRRRAGAEDPGRHGARRRGVAVQLLAPTRRWWT